MKDKEAFPRGWFEMNYQREGVEEVETSNDNQPAAATQSTRDTHTNQ